jgi:hypothetical protein
MRNIKMGIKEIDLGKKSETPKASDVIRIMEERHPILMTEFKKIQQEQYELFAQKQMAYGKGNIMLGGDIDIDEDRIAAIRGITIRLNDKMQRLLNLVLKGITNPLENESVSDTFIDMSVYGIISQIVERGKWK